MVGPGAASAFKKGGGFKLEKKKLIEEEPQKLAPVVKTDVTAERTPQQVNIDQRAGQAFVAAREKLASQLAGGQAPSARDLQEATRQAEQGQLGVSFQNVTTQQAQLNEADIQNALAQVGNTQGIETGIAETPVGADLFRQSLGDVGINAGLKAGLGAAGGVGTAATATALGASAPVSIPLAGAAAVAGLVYAGAGIIPEMKEQYKQNTKVEAKGYNLATEEMEAIIDAINAGDPRVRNRQEAVALYNIALAKVEARERNLRLLGEKDWAKAKDELIAIDRFNTITRPALDRALADALRNPNPNSIMNLPDAINTNEVEGFNQ